MLLMSSWGRLHLTVINGRKDGGLGGRMGDVDEAIFLEDMEYFLSEGYALPFHV